MYMKLDQIEQSYSMQKSSRGKSFDMIEPQSKVASRTHFNQKISYR